MQVSRNPLSRPTPPARENEPRAARTSPAAAGPPAQSRSNDTRSLAGVVTCSTGAEPVLMVKPRPQPCRPAPRTASDATARTARPAPAARPGCPAPRASRRPAPRSGPPHGSVESRCAMMIVVRPTLSRSSASWTSRSDSLSSELVASSSSRIGGSLRIARAIATRWRCPPDSRMPRSPTTVS